MKGYDISWESSASRRFLWINMPYLLLLKKQQFFLNLKLSSAANYRSALWVDSLLVVKFRLFFVVCYSLDPGQAWLWVGSKLFAKVISRQRKELNWYLGIPSVSNSLDQDHTSWQRFYELCYIIVHQNMLPFLIIWLFYLSQKLSNS